MISYLKYFRRCKGPLLHYDSFFPKSTISYPSKSLRNIGITLSEIKNFPSNLEVECSFIEISEVPYFSRFSDFTQKVKTFRKFPLIFSTLIFYIVAINKTVWLSLCLTFGTKIKSHGKEKVKRVIWYYHRLVLANNFWKSEWILSYLHNSHRWINEVICIFGMNFVYLTA